MDNDFNESKDLVKAIKESKTIEEAASLMLKLGLILNGQISLRNYEICKRRFKWVSGSEATLDEIGKTFGVTRERVRQIHNKCGEISVQVEPTPLIFTKLLVHVRQADTEADLINQLLSTGLISSSNWNIDSLKQLAVVANLNNLSQELDYFKKEKMEFFTSNSNVKIVQNLRSKIGLIDLELLCKSLQSDLNKTKSMITSVYSRSIFEDKLCLARGHLTTTYENVLLQQLSINSPLTAEVLYEGIIRECSGRRFQAVGSKEENCKLIKKLCGEEPNLQFLQSNSGNQIPMSSTETWMIEKLNSSPLGMLHLNEWMALALESGNKAGSVNMYLSTSPILRSLGRGMYRLVGVTPSSADIENYSRMIENTVEKVEITYKFEASHLLLGIKPNLSSIASGVLIVKEELASLVRNYRFQIRCTCDNLESESLIQMKSGTFWTGFAAFFRHNIEVHQNNYRLELFIIFDFELAIATLKS
jgi:hypothetical protein